MANYVPAVIQEVTVNPNAARSLATTAEGKRLVDGIRGQTTGLEQLISAQQAARQRAARGSANTAVAVGVVVLIALTALTVALASILGWLLIGRERARERTETLYRASEQTALTLQQSLLPTDLPDLPSCELAIRFAPAGAGELGRRRLLRRVRGRGRSLGGGDRRCVRQGAAGGRGHGDGSLDASQLRHRRRRRRPTSCAGSTTPCSATGWKDASSPSPTRSSTSAPTGRGSPVACAGHPPAIVVSPRGEPERVDAYGDLLGVWPDVRLRGVELELRPGEALVLYTDGVTDQGPTHPGLERSAEQLLRRPGLGAQRRRSGRCPARRGRPSGPGPTGRRRDRRRALHAAGARSRRAPLDRRLRRRLGFTLGGPVRTR